MKIVKYLIWTGFIALLAVSVPKVAWLFRSYEGSTPVLVNLAGVNIDVLWLVPLFVSFCIDALILALTYAVTQDKKKASQAGMWFFIALLCAVSYYCNLLYNLAHLPNGGLWSDTLLSIVTPFIVAGVPLFALCYTLILSRLSGTGETLEEKASRLENEKTAKERIHKAHQGRVTSLLKNAISGVADVTSHALDQLPKKVVNQDVPATLTGHSQDTNVDTSTESLGMLDGYNQETLLDTSVETNGHNTDSLRILHSTELLPFEDTPLDQTDSSLVTFDGYTETSPNGLKSQLYITIEDAARRYGYSVDYLNKLVSMGKVRTKRNNRNHLLVSSLTTYVEEHGRQKQRDTLTNIPTIHVDGE